MDQENKIYDEEDCLSETNSKMSEKKNNHDHNLKDSEKIDEKEN